MKNFDTRAYSVSDFVEWDSQNTLILSPKFQRRAVWTTKAKSYLIDTVVRGKPMPKVLITQELIDGRNVRTVIDGQQRLRAILEFLDGAFTISRTHNREFAGKHYDDLPEENRREILQYEIGVDVLFDTDLPELLDIFARLNTYSVKLNTTELLNASWLGAFKTQSHRLGHSYASFLLDAKILTQAQVSRMAEVELLSDILGTMLVGVSSKKSISSFYKSYDDKDEEVSAAAERVESAMSLVSSIYSPDEIAETNFRRIHLFYALVAAVAAIEIGTPASPTVNVHKLDVSRARVALDELSANFEDPEFVSSGEAEDDFAKFISGARRATTDQSVRQHRVDFIIRRLVAGEA